MKINVEKSKKKWLSDQELLVYVRIDVVEDRVKLGFRTSDQTPNNWDYRQGKRRYDKLGI